MNERSSSSTHNQASFPPNFFAEGPSSKSNSRSSSSPPVSRQQSLPLPELPYSPLGQQHTLVTRLESTLREESETLRNVSKAEVLEMSPRDRRPTCLTDQSLNIFLFVNPTSGGNAAAAFMEGGLEHMRLTVDQPVNLWIWDIRQGSSGEKPGFIKLGRIVEGLKNQGDISGPAEAEAASPADSLQQGQQPQTPSEAHPNNDRLAYVIVAGGDGTVMWCLTELWVHGIDDRKIALGVVPYGTGNDFARALGWQKFNAVHPYENKFSALKKLIREWSTAQIVYHDIWELVMQVHPEGQFQKIDPTTRHKKSVHAVFPMAGKRASPKRPNSLAPSNLLEAQETQKLRLNMCNYFSCGIESRIGVGFDRYRTRNQCLNKFRYFLEGCKKGLCKGTEKINDVTEMLMEECESGDKKILFSTSKLKDELQLGPCTMSLVASNIPSFAAGLDLWGSTKSVGVTLDSGPISPSLTSHQQKLGDGILEFVSFGSALEWALERGIPGHGKRVCKGKGPFELKFKDLTRSQVRLNAQTRIYCQVDGEFFIMTRPESIKIDFKRRIKVLASRSLSSRHLVAAV